MHIFFFLDGGATAVGGVEQLIAQLVDHSLFAAFARISNDPADRQRCPAVGIDLNRHLVVRSTDAARFHFQQRFGVFHRFLEQLQGLIAALGLELGQGLIEDALGRGPLSLPHHRVDELRHQVRPVYGIGRHRPFCDMSFARHLSF